jgi:hypothetical protein
MESKKAELIDVGAWKLPEVSRGGVEGGEGMGSIG